MLKQKTRAYNAFHYHSNVKTFTMIPRIRRTLCTNPPLTSLLLSSLFQFPNGSSSYFSTTSTITKADTISSSTKDTNSNNTYTTTNNNKSSFILTFPGQGAQRSGMGKDLYDSFAIARYTYQEIDEALQLNLSKLMFYDNNNELQQTNNTQPALFTHSLVIYRILQVSFVYYHYIYVVIITKAYELMVL